MTKTQWIDAIRNIRKQLSSFLSVIVIAMIAVLIYLGITFAAAAMQENISNYYSGRNAQDLQVISSLLLTDEDLQAICAVDGVKDAEGYSQTSAWLRAEEKNYELSVLSLHSLVSAPEIHEGRAPQTAQECMLERNLAEEIGLQIGDSLRLTGESTDSDPSMLTESEFTVTGLFSHPDHISDNANYNHYVLVPEDSFDQDLLEGNWMRIRVTLSDIPSNRFSDAYTSTVNDMMAELKTLADERSLSRYEEVREKYEQEIAEGEQKLADAKAELDDAEQQLQKAEDEILDYEQQIADAEDELKEAEETAAEHQDDYEKAKKTLADAEDKLNGVPGQFTNDEARLNAAEQNNQQSLEAYGQGLESYQSGREENDYYDEQYYDALTEYENGKKAVEEYEEKLQELSDAREELEKYKQELEDAKTEFAEAQQELEEARQEYDDACAQLDDARDMLDGLKQSAWVITTNESDSGYVICQELTQNLVKLSGSFALLFVVLAALVIYASVGRMVEDQAIQIGTTKALGFRNPEVLVKYMVFGVLGTVLGMVLGILLAWGVVQPIIINMYAGYFNVEKAEKAFLYLQTLIVVLGGLAVSVASVWGGSGRLLRKTARQLLNGEDLTRLRKKTARKSSFSLYSRLIFLNMLTDLRRVIVTTVAIAGCCLLILIGCMLKSGVSGVVDKEYDEIQLYDVELRFDPDTETALSELSDALDGLGAEYITICRESRSFATGEKLSSASFVATEPGVLDGYYNLYDADTGEPLTIPEEGILITKRVGEQYDLARNSTLKVFDDSFFPTNVEISGIFDAYCERQFFFTNETYHELFDEDPAVNYFYVKLNGGTVSELTEAVREIDGFLTVKDATTRRSRFEGLSSAMNGLITGMVVLAGFMTFFILINLSGNYLTHKKRELTIMRVNGFTVGECIRYAATELVITTIVGILLGFAVGIPLGGRIQLLMETTDIQMIRGVDTFSLVVSSVITAFFSACINALVLRRVKTLKISELNN